MEYKKLSESGIEKPKWVQGDEDQALFNPQFGEIVRIGVVTEKFSYDAFLHNEPIGAVTIPVNKEGKLGFITAFRPTFQPGKEHFPLTDTSVLGRESLELPRGFPIKGERSDQTAKREGSEELGSPIISVRQLGLVTPNTTFHPHQIPVFLCEVDSDFKGDIPGDVNEKILGKIFLTPEEVKNRVVGGEIYCGFTLAALGIWLMRVLGGEFFK